MENSYPNIVKSYDQVERTVKTSLAQLNRLTFI